MVRSHIGSVVCRKALCVRVASSPPKARHLSGLFSYSVVLLAFLLIPYYNEKQAVSAVVLHSAHGN